MGTQWYILTYPNTGEVVLYDFLSQAAKSHLSPKKIIHDREHQTKNIGTNKWVKIYFTMHKEYVPMISELAVAGRM